MADELPKSSGTSTPPQQKAVAAPQSPQPSVAKQPIIKKTPSLNKSQSRATLLFLVATIILIGVIFMMRNNTSPSDQAPTAQNPTPSNVQQTVSRKAEPVSAVRGTVTAVSSRSIGIRSAGAVTTYPIATTVSMQKVAPLTGETKTVTPTGAKISDIKVGDNATLVFDKNTSQVFSIVLTQ